jgi:hypothetical protein
MAKEIYWHCGMGKTGTTYLQHRFFPHLEGIKYLHRTKHHKAPAVIDNQTENKIFYSRECDRQLETEAKRMSAYNKDIKPIIVFRRHDSYLASQYRRAVKNGENMTLQEFIDIDDNKGRWDNIELNFYNKIMILEKHFNHKPLVLFYDDFKKDNYAFFDIFAEYTGSTYQKSKISLAPVHKSYSEKQLKFMLKYTKGIFEQDRTLSDNALVKLWQDKSKSLVVHSLLLAGKFAPDSAVADFELLDKEYLKRVRAWGEEDWNKCLAYAKAYNTVGNTQPKNTTVMQTPTEATPAQ